MSPRLAQAGLPYLPAPVMGLDWSVPFSEVQYPYSPMMLDWLANGATVRVRPDHYLLPDSSLSAGTGLATCVASYEAGNDILYSVPSGSTLGVWSYDLVTETATKIFAPAGPIWDAHVNYQGRVFLAFTSGAYSWDGTTFTHAFTGAAGNTVRDCCIYNNRYYQVQAQTLYFSPAAGGVAGALSSFNLASFYTRGDFSGVKAISAINNQNLQDYIVCCSEGGDLLVFRGDFPGSSNWELVNKLRVPVSNSGSCRMVSYAGDAFIYVSDPATLVSVRTLIQAGLTEAENASPINKQLTFIRENGGTVSRVVDFQKKNALLVQLDGLDNVIFQYYFGPTAVLTSSQWLYCDLKSGAVSQFSYPASNQPFSNGGFFNKTISHSDGYVYTIYNSGVLIYKLLDEDEDTGDSDTTFLQFPYSDLGSPNMTKTLKMAYPILSSPDGQIPVSMVVDTDYDRGLETVIQTFELDTSASTSSLSTKRFVVPIGGFGVQISPTLVNARKPNVSCQGMSIQFEPGGPY